MKLTVNDADVEIDGHHAKPVGDNRHDVELALQASQWLGSSVLQRAAAGHDRERAH